jgi:hypothetical protein
MANGWTPERRAKQAQAIGRWRPWERSTGPQTEAGKTTAAANSRKHGMRSVVWREQQKQINAFLRDCRQRLKDEV